jgi:hypothetical protein
MAMLNNQMVQFHEPSPMTYQKCLGFLAFLLVVFVSQLPEVIFVSR